MSYPFYPAHPSNYTKGRGGHRVKYITIHHIAGTPTTLRYLWGNPNRNGSSHYGVFPKKIEQYVREGDTAWTNGNWRSNQESITIENYGNWQNGYKSPGTLKHLEILLTDLHKRYPKATLTFHQDVSDKPTACPAQLRGYATAIWKRVTTKKSQPKGGKDVFRNKSAKEWFKVALGYDKRIKNYQKNYMLKSNHQKIVEKKDKEIAKLKKQLNSEDSKLAGKWRTLLELLGIKK